MQAASGSSRISNGGCIDHQEGMHYRRALTR